MSHPSWVCGLKLCRSCADTKEVLSHPSWVCGLKLTRSEVNLLKLSHTLRGCVD